VGGVTGPAAEGVRLAWDELPRRIRTAIDDVCGAQVVQAWTQPGGFSPWPRGCGARTGRGDSSRRSPRGRTRTRRGCSGRRTGSAALTPLIAGQQLPVPRLRCVVDRGSWTALVLEDVDGRQPVPPGRLLGMLGAGCESSPTGCSWPTRMPEKYLRRFAALPRGRNCALQLRWPELELLKSIDGVGDAVAHAWLAEIGPAPPRVLRQPRKAGLLGHALPRQPHECRKALARPYRQGRRLHQADARGGVQVDRVAG
jgi:hypothetical protein